MNEHILQITNESELPEALKIDQSYQLSINADVKNIQKKSNEDGTYTFVYKARQNTCEILDATGKVIKTKDTKKQSQKLRQHIEFLRKEFRPEEEEEAFYERSMQVIRHYAEDILRKDGII